MVKWRLFSSSELLLHLVLSCLALAVSPVESQENGVWAIITPPGFSTGHSAIPVTNLPMVELNHPGGGRCEVSYSGCSTFGRYHVAAYAIDDDGNVSSPATTHVTVGLDPDADVPTERAGGVLRGGNILVHVK